WTGCVMVVADVAEQLYDGRVGDVLDLTASVWLHHNWAGFVVAVICGINDLANAIKARPVWGIKFFCLHLLELSMWGSLCGLLSLCPARPMVGVPGPHAVHPSAVVVGPFRSKSLGGGSFFCHASVRSEQR